MWRQNMLSENFLGVNPEHGFAGLPTKILVDSAFIMANWSKNKERKNLNLPSHLNFYFFLSDFSYIFPVQPPRKKNGNGLCIRMDFLEHFCPMTSVAWKGE